MIATSTIPRPSSSRPTLASQTRSRGTLAAVHKPAGRVARRVPPRHDRLQVEKRAQSTPLRVEKLARDQLYMRTPTPAITQYVGADGSIAPGSALPAMTVASAPRVGRKP